jgi:hypothetical protein
MGARGRREEMVDWLMLFQVDLYGNVDCREMS